MTVKTEPATKKTLTLGKKLDLKKAGDTDQVRQSFAHGRSKTVEVEVKRRRALAADEKPEDTIHTDAEQTAETNRPAGDTDKQRRLTDKELAIRLEALKTAKKREAVEAEEKVRREIENATV